jgi:hypothetical protein
VTPSQVTEVEPTVQVVFPVQLTVLPFEQFWVALQMAMARGEESRASRVGRTTRIRIFLFIEVSFQKELRLRPL